MTNSLEDLLVQSVKKAQKEYLEMTGGYPLWHAPESFVQMQIARDIVKKLGVYVYPECTPISLANDANTKVQIGRPPNINKQQRFDLVVWWKNEAKARAIIELKLTYASMTGVVKDGQKLLDFRLKAKSHNGLRTGYLVVYNSAYRNLSIRKNRQGAETIQARFDDASAALSKLGVGNQFKLVEQFISKERSINDTHTEAYGVAVWSMSFT